jgi:hypothetical protein
MQDACGLRSLLKTTRTEKACVIALVFSISQRLAQVTENAVLYYVSQWRSSRTVLAISQAALSVGGHVGSDRALQKLCASRERALYCCRRPALRKAASLAVSPSSAELLAITGGALCLRGGLWCDCGGRRGCDRGVGSTCWWLLRRLLSLFEQAP